MENLTKHLNIVGTEQTGIHPQVGCYLVLFKQVDEGRVFHSVLTPGVRLEQNALKRFFKKDALVSIPVTASASLRHEFTSYLDHVTPGHFFEADYVLGLAVASPERVASRWAEDPVRKVEEEVKRLVSPKLCAKDWQQLRNNILRDGAEELFQDELRDLLSDIQPFAEDYGIALCSIRVILRLSRTERETERRKAEMQADHEVKLLETDHKAELGKAERQEEIRGAIAGGAKKVIDNIAVNTNRPEELERTIRSLSSMMADPRGITGAVPGASGVAALNPAPFGPERKALAAITEVVEIIENLTGNERRRRELFSALMHLIAEAYRDGVSHSDGTKNYQEYEAQAATLIASDWHGSLPGPQYLALKRFSDDFAALCERLK